MEHSLELKLKRHFETKHFYSIYTLKICWNNGTFVILIRLTINQYAFQMWGRSRHWNC